MKILFCISSLAGGGAETQLYYLSTELSKNGHEVHVYYLWDNSNTHHQWGHVQLHKCEVNSNYSLKIFLRLINLLSKYNFDIVQTWVVQMDILVGMLTPFYNYKWVLREPSSSKNYDDSFKNKLRVLFSSGASVIVSNSIAGNSYWESKNTITKKKVILNGVPYEKISFSLKESTQLKLPSSEYILYVGRLVDSGTAQKNISQLILAFDLVLRVNSNLKLLLVGDGKDTSRFKSLVKNLKIENSVLFLGYQSSDIVYHLMNKSLLFVSLSQYEGCPNTVLEALYSCDRILLSCIDEHTTIFPDNLNDHFVDPSDINEIASKIIDSIASESKKEIYKKLTEKYMMKKMIKDYSVLYSELISINLN